MAYESLGGNDDSIAIDSVAEPQHLRHHNLGCYTLIIPRQHNQRQDVCRTRIQLIRGTSTRYANAVTSTLFLLNYVGHTLLSMFALSTADLLDNVWARPISRACTLQKCLRQVRPERLPSEDESTRGTGGSHANSS